MKIRTKIASLLSIIGLVGGLASCDNSAEALDLQTPYTYSEQYYENLREFKKSDHSVSFMWFADYSASHSYGLHFMGLPDSLDICSLWGGIPSDIEGRPNTFYNPKVYKEMRFIQEVKGTKLTFVTFPSVGVNAWLEEYPTETKEDTLNLIKAFGDSLIRTMDYNKLDGMDLDYEIHGDWMHGENFVTLIEYLGKHIGPKSERPEKMLIVDFYSDYPPAGTEEYVTYFIRQAYTQGFTEHNASRLQSYYNNIGWTSPSKFIVTENIGDHWQTGGSPFTEVDGNQFKSNGERLYSLEGMARWDPYEGKKGGFGAFYGHRDYNSNPPYKHFRNGIQAQNPAVQ